MSSDIVEQGESVDYVVVDVDQRIARLMANYNGGGFHAKAFSRPAEAPSNFVGAGDILSVRILEAGNSGLFSQGPIGNSGNTVFAAIVVDTAGNITFPYVGEIKVAGSSPKQIQEKIVVGLEGKAIEPQAVVVVKQSRNNIATVAGDLVKPGRYELTLRGDRLTDAISNSGGSKFPAHETTVTVVRDGQTGSMGLDEVLENPRNNIKIQRGDLIVLTRDRKRYTMMGAVPKAGTVPFFDNKVSVLEAVAGAGGLLDVRADPTGVFVFRYESDAILSKLGVTNISTYQRTSRGVPTIYRFDFQLAQTHFLAQSFLLVDKDAVYVSNAETVQLSKFLRLLDLGLEPIERTAVISRLR